MGVNCDEFKPLWIKFPNELESDVCKLMIQRIPAAMCSAKYENYVLNYHTSGGQYGLREPRPQAPPNGPSSGRPEPASSVQK